MHHRPGFRCVVKIDSNAKYIERAAFQIDGQNVVHFIELRAFLNMLMLSCALA